MGAGAGPIGVFDSGVGGLSVLREIRRELPDHALVYVADSGFAPYGERSAAFIQQRSEAVTRFLLREGAEAVVVACNSATGAAVDALRRQCDVPIVAIEPAVKPAAAATRSGVVGVLATSATLASAKFGHLVDRYGAAARVVVQPCPGLAEQVERGDLAGAATRSLVERYVRPLVEAGADTLVVGCTHYAFLIPVIRAAAGDAVAVVDPAAAVAREVRRRLMARAQPPPLPGGAVEAFWSSGPLDRVNRVLAELWAPDAAARALPADFCVPPRSDPAPHAAAVGHAAPRSTPEIGQRDELDLQVDLDGQGILPKRRG